MKGNYKMKKTKRFKVHKRQPKHTKEENNVQPESDDECDALDMIDDQELENIKRAYNVPRINGTKRGKKRKVESSDDEETYENQPRNSFIPKKKMYSLLPIKGKDGVIPQSISIEEKDEDNTKEQKSNTCKLEALCLEKPLSLTEKLAERQKEKAELKLKIGHLSSCIVENPEGNMSCLKSLTIMLKNRDPSANLVITKLIILSLLEIYKDIIPSYKIRSLSEKEKKQKMKKETRKLTNYEECLLRYYKQYLDFLEKSVRTTLKLEKVKKHNIFTERKRNVGFLAIQCLNELLVTHPHFNYNLNVINILVPLMTHKNLETSEKCCASVSTVFKDDKLGETSLLIVRRIVKLIKERQGSVLSDVLRTFLSLNIKESDIMNDQKEKKDIKKIRANLAKMSRREKKQNKRMQNLEKELKDAEVEENKSQKAKDKSEILQNIFQVYFRILKSSTRSPLLTPVLEGLSKFAHLINIEFFDDLIAVLYKLIESGNLADCEILHSLRTVFIILSGQGSLLNIDPQGFFKYLYKILLRMHVGITSENFSALLSCLDIMVLKRLKVNTLQRTLAFLKRLCTVSLQSNINGTFAILSVVRTLMINCNKSDILLDIDTSLGSGVFQPELDDPEHCNAYSSVLWELHLLNLHYHPTVRSYANNILNGCPLQGKLQLPSELAKLKADELFAKYNPKDLNMKIVK